MFTDHYYSSPSLFESLLGVGIRATGTLRTSRVGVPSSVVALKAVLAKKKTDRGTGYYVRTSSTVYVCWKDVRVVTLISTAYLGHSEGTVSRRTSAGKVAVQVPLPVVRYNSSMGGVDKSDQYLSYHNTLRHTARYWQTLFYHAVDIAVVNSFILYNVLAYRAGERRVSENDYRDRGTGYYVRTSSTVYVCWKDVRVVTLISTAYLGHSEGTDYVLVSWIL